MKKIYKSLLCSILIVVLVGANTACYATNEENDNIYVSLGDSIAIGLGLEGNSLRGSEQADKNLIYCYKTPGSYPVLLASKMGIQDDHFYQLACAGMRTVELLHCLDENYVIPDHFANNFSEDDLTTFDDILSAKGIDYVEIVSKASIITLNMCANDIATYALFAVRNAMENFGVRPEIIDGLCEDGFEHGDYCEVLSNLLSYARQNYYYSKVLLVAIQGLSEGYTRWTENWDAICKRIYEINPDVDLYCIGMYNPFSNTKLSADYQIRIGTALDGLIASIDSWALAGSEYANKYTYVSILGIESMLSASNNNYLSAEVFVNDFELKVHPSAKGHEQIASRVMSVMKISTISESVKIPDNISDNIQKQLDASMNSIAEMSRSITKMVSGLTKLFNMFK